MDYREPDMAPGAVFVSDYRNLNVQLECQEEEILSGVPKKKAGTGCRVPFKNGRATVDNKKAFALMLEHPLFNAGRGFHIDKTDPTGFWRAAGMVKEVEVKTFVADGEPSLPKSLNVAKVMERLNKMEDKPSPLSAVKVS